MFEKVILENQVYWSYDYQLAKKGWAKIFTGLFSFMAPLHNHKGNIVVTNDRISIEGDKNLTIPLSGIEELYIGFDDNYPASAVKSLGMFWQPLRIRYLEKDELNTVYLIIGFDFITAQNQLWYDTITGLLS